MSNKAMVNAMHEVGLITDAQAETLVAGGTLGGTVSPVGAAVSSVATADAGGTYTATEQALINELKAQVNALLTSLRNAGIITT